jgi:hypothetical protein
MNSLVHTLLEFDDQKVPSSIKTDVTAAVSLPDVLPVLTKTVCFEVVSLRLDPRNGSVSTRKALRC